MFSTTGVSLMQAINDGTLKHVPTAYIDKSRRDISEAIEELLEVGARIRPLYSGEAQVGWVRGVHMSERKILRRWVPQETDTVRHLLTLGTSLSRDEINELSMVEVRSLMRVIREMTESDMRLYPFMAAFVTTNISEQLWFSRGIDLSSYVDKTVTLPDKTAFRVAAPPDHARLWSTLCTYRVNAKQRLEANLNALLIIRPWVGKGADPIASDLKTMGRNLQTDTIEAWKEVVKEQKAANLDDGWAHSEDDSVEGMQRELAGMLNNDRHEQLITRLETAEREKAQRRQDEIDARIAARGGRGFIESGPMEVMTEEEVQERTASLNAGRPIVPPHASDLGSQSSLLDRLAKYK